MVMKARRHNPGPLEDVLLSHEIGKRESDTLGTLSLAEGITPWAVYFLFAGAAGFANGSCFLGSPWHPLGLPQ